MGRAARRPLPAPAVVRIEDLDSDGRGVGRVDGKVVFVTGALLGETVLARYRRVRGKFDEAEVESVLEASPRRVEPRCAWFDRCGGCSLQHVAHEAQIVDKQRLLMDTLAGIGAVRPERVLDPLTASPWNYRRRARLGVKHVPAKGGALVGFRERGGGRIAEIERCEILAEPVASLILPLRRLVSALAARARIPQIEVAVADDATALVFRHLDPLTADDRGALAAFGREHDVQVFLQAGGPDSITPLEPQAPLRYRLPEFDLALDFAPNDFVQVNGAINESLLGRVVELLELDGSEAVLDLFCGLGNFTLPMARRTASVHGVEGDPVLVARARGNALGNGVANASFATADLFDPVAAAAALTGDWHRMVLDPPRAGALAVVESMRPPYPRRVVYVSCGPATLARDASVLVERHGYRLAAAGIADMFPHTSHVEAVACFVHDAGHG